ALRRSGACSEDEIARMDERQLYSKLFEPGFSTAATVDEHAGRGVGLDLVAERVRALGGRLKLVSRPKHFTEFSIRFAGSPSPEGA
ncbi:MAG TPA: ATP-binding protein, partial [Bacteroidales bacterium]|nr:ATP-binding protein [Bacteroidales bacterium]